MSEPFVGEIRMFAGNFAPRGWSFCEGQLLAISQNDALFSLLGTIYGGDGRTTFGLPDMRGRLPVHMGAGPGLSTRAIGLRTGAEQVALSTNELPSHTHDMQASTAQGVENNPAGKYSAVSPNVRIYRPATPNTSLAANSVSSAGAGQAHNNMMPFLCVHFIIALTGIFPSRN